MCPWLFTIYSVGGNRPSESSAFMTTDGHLKPSLYTEMTWNIDELLPSRPEHINDPAQWSRVELHQNHELLALVAASWGAKVRTFALKW